MVAKIRTSIASHGKPGRPFSAAEKRVSRARSSAETKHNWHVLAIRAGSERAVKERADEHGIEVYYPVERRMSEPKPGKPAEPVERPAMPGYAFVCLPSKAAPYGLFCGEEAPSGEKVSYVEASPGVRVPWVEPRPAPILGAIDFVSSKEATFMQLEKIRSDVDVLKGIELSGGFDEVKKEENENAEFQRWLRPGKNIKITKGNWRGFGGIIEEILSSKRVKAAIGLFGRMTPVELEMGSFVRAKH